MVSFTSLERHRLPRMVIIIAGDLLHFNVLGSHVIVINSEEIANDLLEKRSGIPHAAIQDDAYNGYCIPKGAYMAKLDFTYFNVKHRRNKGPYKSMEVGSPESTNTMCPHVLIGLCGGTNASTRIRMYSNPIGFCLPTGPSVSNTRRRSVSDDGKPRSMDCMAFQKP